VEMPALAPSGRPGQAAAQPETAPKAGGAGGSRILSGDRPGIDAAPAAAASATAGSTPARPGISVGGGAASGAPTPAFGSGSGASPALPPPVATAPIDRGVAPPTVRPGRAMAPAGPSSPAGTAPPVPPTPVADGG
ncbi:MAG: hypothetical protein AB7U92_16685, partial [Piscinibacter sp.]